MVESASKQFIGLFIKHLVEDLITYQQHHHQRQNKNKNTNHHPINSSNLIRNHKKNKMAAKLELKTQCKRLLNRASLNHRLQASSEPQLTPLDNIMTGHQQQPWPKEEPTVAAAATIERHTWKHKHNQHHHGRPNSYVFIAELPKYNRLNLKYFSSRKTAKRLRYLLSLDAKKKPR